MAEPSNEDIRDATETFWEAEALGVLERYLEIPSLSPAFDQQWESSGHIESAITVLKDWATSRPIPGIAVDIQRLAGRTPLLVIDIPASVGREQAPRVVLYGHLDKQPPMLPWRQGLDPYRPVREGDRLFGRGAADDGYSIFAALGAIEVAARGNGHPACLVIIEASEESGSPDLPAHLEALAPRIGSPDVVFCLDSGGPTLDRLWLTSSLRGLIGGRLSVEVLRQGMHSGRGGGVVPSSFRVLRQLLSRLEDERTGKVLVTELTPAPPASVVERSKALAHELGDLLEADVPKIDGLRLEGESSAQRLVAMGWGSSLEVVGMDGAPPTAEAGNVLRPSTVAQLSIRLPPTVDPDVAEKAVAALLTEDPPSGARVKWESTGRAPGWVIASLPAWLEAAIDQGSRSFYGAPSAQVSEGGSIPFLAFLAARYPQSSLVVTGILGPASNAHGPDEMLDITAVKSLTATLAYVLGEVAKESRP